MEFLIKKNNPIKEDANMRKIITFILMLVGLSTYASKGCVYYVSGDLEAFKKQAEEVDVSVILDVSKTTYMCKYSFKEFLRLYRRERGWETSCLDYFYEKFNQKIRCMTACDENSNTKYQFVIKVQDIDSRGFITAHIYVNELTSDKPLPLLHLILIGQDGDKNDPNPMRDPMKDAGEAMGVFFHKWFTLRTVTSYKDYLKNLQVDDMFYKNDKENTNDEYLEKVFNTEFENDNY